MIHKIFFPVLFILIANPIFAQQKIIGNKPISVNISGDEFNGQKLEDLYLLGKVWGFLKYFHPQVAEGKFDWDKELVDFLPGYLKAKSKKERNDSLLSWINRLGDIPSKKAGDYRSIKKYKLLPDFSWISNKNFGNSLMKKLNFILDNRKQGDQYYIKFYRTEGLNIPEFQHEKTFSQNECPPLGIRLITLYRFWNVIEYWYPYKYNLPTLWDTVLKNELPLFWNVSNIDEYTLSCKRLLATIHDGHGALNSLTANNMIGYYYMPVRFDYVQQKIIISSISNDSISAKAGLAVGDVVESIDGVRASEILKQKLPYTSGSNKAYQIYSICLNLNRTTKPSTIFEINNGTKKRTITVMNTFTKRFVNQYVSNFNYQRDSSLCLLKNNIAYLNMGKLTMKDDSARIVDMIEKCKGIIIDARQNAVEEMNRENPIGLLENLLCEGKPAYIFSTGQPDFAGVFKLVENSEMPFKPHKVKYNIPIVILINEKVISIGEYMTMIFSKAPKAVLMGSNTSGTDGPVTSLTLPGVFITFTGTGIYWKDGGETQRVGLKPDIEVYPTIKGFKNNKDELIEKAIQYLSK